MILVFCASSAVERGDPVLTADNRKQLLKMMQAPTPALTAGQLATLRSILARVPEDAAVEITLHANGTIFRLKDHEEPKPVARDRLLGEDEDGSWLPREQGASILLGDTSPRAVRLSHVCQFLGYDAHALVTDRPTAVLDRVTAERPHVVVIGEPSWLSSNKDLAQVVAQEKVGLVTLGLSPPGAPASVTAAVLDVPFQVRRIAPTLDPVIASVKAARGEMTLQPGHGR